MHVKKKQEEKMKEISLRNYKSVEKFIEAVEHAPAWEVIATEDYEEALEKVGLDYHDYNDFNEMWDDFIKAIEE